MRRSGSWTRVLRFPAHGLLSLAAVSPAAANTALAQEAATAFVHVNVLPMDRERILEDHTVLVRNGVIEGVAPSHRLSPPAGARIIEGEGLFLLPGLGDMDVRLPTPNDPLGPTRDVLFLYLANGITVVRGVEGRRSDLALKRNVASGALMGPTIYVGSPRVDGRTAPDGEAAISQMMAYRALGFDYLTVGEGLALPTWDSLADEAHSRGYTFGGEIPTEVGLRHAFSTGISFVSDLSGFLFEVTSDGVRARLARGEAVPLAEQLAAVEGRRIRAIAAHARSADAWVVPNLHRVELSYRFASGERVPLDLPELRYVPRGLKESWESGPPLPPWPLDSVGAAQWIQVRRRTVRALVMAGVGVMPGSGSPAPFLVPGFSLHYELEGLLEARLTPYEALVAATRNVAAYARRELREPGNFGTVEEGNRADLLLLRANPFLDLDALRRPAGVMIRGRWISEEEIQTRLEEIAARASDSRSPPSSSPSQPPSPGVTGSCP